MGPVPGPYSDVLIAPFNGDKQRVGNELKTIILDATN